MKCSQGEISFAFSVTKTRTICQQETD
jgi:hypothetical protein